MGTNVVVLGASHKPQRYAYMAARDLRNLGYPVQLVNPRYKEIEGEICHPDLQSCTQPIDTITLYLNPKTLRVHLEGMIAVQPRRVIFNPGTEDEELESALAASGIEVERACTLVLLQTGQF
ncbi:MAG: CoA-binding protein [bacterium]